MTTELPVFNNDILSNATTSELIERLVENEDRVPRNVIDECVSRGDAMADALAPWAKATQETDEHPGRWWLRLHAIMILGLIPGERSSETLLAFIRDLCEGTDENLQEWFAGFWPALTRNKPTTLIEQLRAICLDRNIDWFMRSNLLEAVIASAYREGEKSFEDILDLAAGIAADETEDWDMRLLTASELLNFPRPRHLALLEELAAQQTGLGKHFDKADISKGFSRNTDQPGWRHHENPWQFYEPQAIKARQERWAIEDREAIDSEYLEDWSYQVPATYTREIPKIGRNDPCPCGSGKKYKKCCLGKA